MFSLSKILPNPKEAAAENAASHPRDIIPQGIIEALRPYAHTSLVFDVETTVDAHSGQLAKVGFWQDHGLGYPDRCALFAEGLLTPEVMDHKCREGMFYNQLTCKPEEVETVKTYAAKHGLCCMEMNDFITKVF